jgi:dolichol-phosphate mannosyltransferase
MKLSVVIPAYNEEESLPATVEAVVEALTRRGVDHEVLVVNDNSRDGTEGVLEALARRLPTLRHSTNTGPNGFGYAVRHGLERFSGDCVAVMMADLSDSPEDLLRFYDALVGGGYDCVFGSRFIRGGRVVDYPLLKRVINRIANLIIRLSMNIDYNDATNAFKMYRRSTIEGLKPFLSPHFNLTIELPLKAIIRGYSYTVLPNTWHNRKYGVSKLAIREMGTRYFFILCYCLIEKYFSKGDFRKKW